MSQNESLVQAFAQYSPSGHGTSVSGIVAVLALALVIILVKLSRRK